MKLDNVLRGLLNSYSAFSTLNSGLRDETSCHRHRATTTESFSTLNSGLRDETPADLLASHTVLPFQYPQLGPTR